MARIGIFGKFSKLLYHPSPNGIEVDVANEFKKVWILLNYDAFIPVLEEMTFSTMTQVMPDGVAGHKATHHGGKKHYTWPDKKVKVIRQQAPGKQLYPALDRHLGKATEELIVVPGVPEYVLPLDAPRHHMV